MSEFRICSAFIDKENKIIYIDCEKNDFYTFKEAEGEICKQIGFFSENGEDSKINVQVCTRCLIDINKVIENGSLESEIRESMHMLNPALNACISSEKFEYDSKNNLLLIKLNQKLRSYFKACSADIMLSSYVKRIWGYNINIDFLNAEKNAEEQRDSGPVYIEEKAIVVDNEAYEKEHEAFVKENEKKLKQGGKQDSSGKTWSGNNGYSGKKSKGPKKKRLTPQEGSPLLKDSAGRTIYMGKEIISPITPIKNLTKNSGTVAIRGRLFFGESIVTKKNWLISTCSITDGEAAFSFKLFHDPEDLPYMEKTFCGPKNYKKYLTVQGTVEYDEYSKMDVIMPTDIVEYIPEARKDNAPVKRVELHLHTNMSAQDAIVKPEEIVPLVSSWGHPALAVTDHGVIQAYQGIFNALPKEKEEAPLKIIYGVEGYLCQRTKDMTLEEAKKLRSWHVIILVKNLVGLKNLYKLISSSNLEYFYKRPRMPRFEIEAHREGLIIGSACSEGELFEAVLNNESQEKLEQIANFYDYLEIQPVDNNAYLLRNGKLTDRSQLEEINKKILALGDKVGKMTVATGDVHFINPEDAIYRCVMQAGQKYEDADLQPPLYMRTTDEMLAEFEYLGERAYEVVVENTNKIADMIERLRPVPKGFFPPRIEGSDENLRNSANEKARSIYGDPLPELVEKRLDRELNSIINNGYSIMYITAKELVAESARNGYQVGSRGSVGSSLAAYMAGITEVNSLPAHYRCKQCGFLEFHENEGYDCGFDMPIKNCPNCDIELIRDGFDIPFETFLGFDGDKVPDIDLNFASEDQARAHKYTEVLFGEGYVFRAGTIAGLAEKTAEGYARKYLEDRNKDITSMEVKRLAEGFTGVKRTTGQHPGAIMVIPKDMEIYDFTPIQHPADKSDTITTHFDYHFLHDNILKLDILGHDGPAILKLLEDFSGLSSLEVDINDRKVLSLFCSPDSLELDPKLVKKEIATGTLGIPEMGTKLVMSMLLETKPTSVSELVRISGLSHGTGVWAGNIQDLIASGTCKLSEAICCRDDIMLYLISKGLEKKTAFTIMESVRKGKGLKPEWEEDMRAHNVPEWYIESCKKIQYMFPKAHAVAYVVMALRIAWFKVYRPLAYYAARFTMKIDKFDATYMIHGIEKAFGKMTILGYGGSLAELEDADVEEMMGEEVKTDISQKEESQQEIYDQVLEMYARGYNFLPVDIYKSEATRFVPEGDKIRPPLCSLQGVGASAAENIVKARDKLGTFLSIEDLKTSANVNKSVIEALTKEGCLDGWQENNQISLFDLFD